MAIVHVNGIHHIPVYPCICSEAEDIDIQLFTFPLLEDYHLTLVECHVLAEKFDQKLRRLTCSVAPNNVLDRKRELSRTWRQWNHLKDNKRCGFGHSNEQPGEGALALFCGACPQPGINVPEGWEMDTDQQKYRLALATDCNMVLNHLAGSGEYADVWLQPGMSYMANRGPYASHCAVAQELDEPSTCDEHRAVKDKHKSRKGYDSTGLVAVACNRHGCFAPGSVVDMQKGEKQLHAGYSVAQAVRLLKLTLFLGLLFYYDINCWYSVNFWKRMSKAPWLKFPQQKDYQITFGIGAFHVHGHQEVCLPRYGPTYIPGAGTTSREILESLWSILNKVASITRSMSRAHRSELLDAVMEDINWKKLVGMGKNSQEEAIGDFRLLDIQATIAQRENWSAVMKNANDLRHQDVTGLDSYLIHLGKVAPKKVVQVDLMEEERTRNSGLGLTDWIACGIEIQEMQGLSGREKEEPETLPVLLPSSLPNVFHQYPLAKEIERKLHIAQANETLEAMRAAIGHKSFLYRSDVRLARGYWKRTLAYKSVQDVNDGLRQQIKVYSACRWSLERLGAHDDLQKFKALQPKDTLALTSVYDPNSRGQRDASLSWIWKVDLPEGHNQDDYLQEYDAETR
ncbi:hypothetical protein FA15DRAFT_683413 [Coprinopsis marcescibilis]|uniref:CxC2-like cysteine cluster KDZ transposase-associated domain-containing protein n=1 Tax=Coprinopsis marcescibilis TaxID=230819 RepID=A0A5C3KCX3_COPMA|nr:hypothetical protein FA15DRAFT_683413 [Coprinopsis marcescibilis]